MKNDCKTHPKKLKYCEDCLLEINAEQAVIIDHLQSRLDSLWATCPETQEVIMELEKVYPLSGVYILHRIPFSETADKYFDRGQIGQARGEMRELFSDLLDLFSQIRITEPQAKIGASPDGFFIYKVVKARDHAGKT